MSMVAEMEVHIRSATSLSTVAHRLPGRAREVPRPIPGPACSATGWGWRQTHQGPTRVFTGSAASSETGAFLARPTGIGAAAKPGGADHGVSGHDDNARSGRNHRPDS